MPKYTVLLPLILRPPLPRHRYHYPHVLCLVVQPHAARVRILYRHRHRILRSPTIYAAILLGSAPISAKPPVGGDGPRSHRLSPTT